MLARPANSTHINVETNNNNNNNNNNNINRPENFSENTSKWRILLQTGLL